jgi:tetratricopeptide (TPR) repeat protein
MKQTETSTLHDELRQTFLSTCEGQSGDGKIHILKNLALMELDTWGNTSLALRDMTEAVTLAGNDKEKIRRHIPLYFRILFTAEKFDELLKACDEYDDSSGEINLWRSIARFSLNSEFPVINRHEIRELGSDVLYIYSVMALNSGYTEQARMAAANAASFRFREKCSRIIAESYFDDKNYIKAGRIYRRMLKDNPSNPVGMMRYADGMVLCGKVDEAFLFISRLKVSEEAMYSKNFMLCALSFLRDDTDCFKKHIDIMGSYEQGPLYNLYLCRYYRLTGRTKAALEALETSRSLLPRKFDPPKQHVNILLCCDIEESILNRNNELLSLLSSNFHYLPVMDRLYYENYMKEHFKADNIISGMPVSGMPVSGIKRFFAKVIIAAIMILCVLFLVYLETMLIE